MWAPAQTPSIFTIPLWRLLHVGLLFPSSTAPELRAHFHQRYKWVYEIDRPNTTNTQQTRKYGNEWVCVRCACMRFVFRFNFVLCSHNKFRWRMFCSFFFFVLLSFMHMREENQENCQLGGNIIYVWMVYYIYTLAPLMYFNIKITSFIVLTHTPHASSLYRPWAQFFFFGTQQNYNLNSIYINIIIWNLLCRMNVIQSERIYFSYAAEAAWRVVPCVWVVSYVNVFVFGNGT